MILLFKKGLNLKQNYYEIIQWMLCAYYVAVHLNVVKFSIVVRFWTSCCINASYGLYSSQQIEQYTQPLREKKQSLMN